MHFQLRKYKIFLCKGVLPPCNQGASPLDPHALRGFDEYQFHHVHSRVCIALSYHCDFDASWAWKKIVSHNTSILPSFQSYNALICNILIFGIIFDYDYHQFWLIYGLRVLQKGLKIDPSDCIQMSKASELPGGRVALPLDPTRGPTAGP